jgi:predicted O-methyltransferase YrrM
MAKLAEGVQTGRDSRQIVCEFDEDTFMEIRELAARGGVSFRAQVRLLVEHGLETLKQAAE